MGNLAFSVTTNRPRTISTPGDWAATQSYGNYGTIDPNFRTRLQSEAANIAATSTAAICRNSGGTGSPRSDIHLKVLTLQLANRVVYGQSYDTFTGSSFTWANKVLDIASYIAGTLTPLGQYGVNSRRSALLALAYALDFDYAFMNSGNITTIGNGINTLCDLMTLDSLEIFDGHSSGDQACQFIGALALHGEAGFTSGGSNALTRLQEAVNFWWGGEASVTINGESRLAFNRYFCSAGGHGKSVWYSMLEGWYTSLILQAAQNGLTGMTLNGEAYSLPGSETWVDKLGEWFLNFAMRGDLDYWHLQGDTERVSNPWLHEYTSTTLAYLIAKSPTWRRTLRWLYDKLLQKTASLSQNPVYNRVTDYVFFDPAAAANLPLPPESASPVPARSKLFDPPGIYVYRNNWNITGTAHCAVAIEAQSYFWRGHSSDLKCGSIQIILRDDVVLMNRGVYDSNQDNVADFGGTYTNNWSRQSISASGVPLIDDLASPVAGSPTYTGTPHADRNENGNQQAYPHATGGQLWRFDHTAGSSPTPDDPYTITEMTGSDLTWRRVTGIDGSTSVGLKVEDETADLVFLTCDLHRAYIQRTDHLNTANDRVEICTLKLMVIKTESQYPIVFRVARVKSRQASYRKRDVWQFYGNPVVGDFATTGRFSAPGYRMSEEGSTALGGKCLIAYHNFGDLNSTQAGDASKTWTAANANHHAYTVGNTTTLSRFPLSEEPNFREKTDAGRFRVEISPKTQEQDNTFVNLIVPLAPTDTEPDFTLLDDSNYWIVRFGGVASTRVYKIHKTAISYEGPGDPLDTIPPNPPVIGATAGPGSGQVTVSWNPASEPDFRATRVSYRVKV